MDELSAIAAFAALSQATRLNVLRLLIKAGPEGLTAGEIGEALSVRQNTMSANLQILAQSGLVRSAREGRTIRYFADFETVRGLISFLMRDCCGSRPELCTPVLEALNCGC
jgi:ArsR family transcriptional regulator, arsenate/arsenite/antimonite-responsive transcriptional repressor